VLKSNITATAAEWKPIWILGCSGCIVIAANFVTINLSGYVITRPGGSSVAIARDTTTRTRAGPHWVLGPSPSLPASKQEYAAEPQLARARESMEGMT
jgi:hypothetical protein